MLQRGADIADHTLYNVMCGLSQYAETGNVWSNAGVPKICFGGEYLHHYPLDYSRQFLAG